LTQIVGKEYVDDPLNNKNNMDDDKIIEMLLKHEARLDRIEKNMATKQDLAGISETLDKILAISTSNSQEIGMTHRAIERLNDKDDEQDKVIGRIQHKLDFA